MPTPRPPAKGCASTSAKGAASSELRRRSSHLLAIHSHLVFTHAQHINLKTISTHLKGHPHATQGTAYAVLLIISFSHLLNDLIQSVIPAIYPVIKQTYGYTFTQIGIITLVFQMTSSILQPFTGRYADRHPRPYALSAGMCCTLAGLLLLAYAQQFGLILLAAAIIGLGSSVFHPEASRVAQMASGGRKSLAQSIFQVGGNGGAAVGPLLAALVVLPFGQTAISWFALAAIVAALILVRVGSWYSVQLAFKRQHPTSGPTSIRHLPERQVKRAMLILVMLIFTKYFYISCMTSYFTFFLIDKFGLSIQHSQFCLFAFLGALAIGTLGGGMLGDRFGRKYVIWFSILGASPFALLLPYANLAWTIVLATLTGLIIASAFSAIVVYATDLMPDKVGMVAGVFFGLMFGLGGLGSAFFGWLADLTSMEFVFQASAWLPLLGFIAGFLPDTRVGHEGRHADK